MNQIAASILILSASILGYTATVRSSSDGFGGMLGLIAIGLGLWGCMALLTSSLRDRELILEQEHGISKLGSAAMSGLRNFSYPPSRSNLGAGHDYHVSAETNARISAAARLRGQNRDELVEETLRRHLPKYTSSSAA